jgi:hypothetical protein
MLFGSANIEKALGVKVMIDSDAQRLQQLWRDMMAGKAPWNSDNVPSLMLAKGVSKEAARYTASEFESEITGSVRADFLNEQYQRVAEDTIENVTSLTGGGSIILKPYVRGSRIMVSTVTNDCFYPLRYNEIGEMVGVVFADVLQREDYHYTLLETHEWDEMAQTYSISYRAFVSDKGSDIGAPVPLTEVAEWAHLQSDNQYANIAQPLFVECNMPDKRAIFADAVDIIKEADEQLGRTIWEYYGGELAIDISSDLLKRDETGVISLPRGKDRLYRSVNSDPDQFAAQVFNPNFRDDSLFRGLNEYKRTIEFIVGFAYGVISDPNMREKTAEEIRAGKQRFFVTIGTIQKRVEAAYKRLIASMDIISTIYALAPTGTYETSYTWGDSIMEDPDKEYARRKEMVGMGLLKPELFNAWYFGVTEEAALEMMPGMADETGIMGE